MGRDCLAEAVQKDVAAFCVIYVLEMLRQEFIDLAVSKQSPFACELFFSSSLSFPCQRSQSSWNPESPIEACQQTTEESMLSSHISCDLGDHHSAVLLLHALVTEQEFKGRLAHSTSWVSVLPTFGKLPFLADTCLSTHWRRTLLLFVPFFWSPAVLSRLSEVSWACRLLIQSLSWADTILSARAYSFVCCRNYQPKALRARSGSQQLDCLR